jgi:hypothetical protein
MIAEPEEDTRVPAQRVRDAERELVAHRPGREHEGEREERRSEGARRRFARTLPDDETRDRQERDRGPVDQQREAQARPARDGDRRRRPLARAHEHPHVREQREREELRGPRPVEELPAARVQEEERDRREARRPAGDPAPEQEEPARGRRLEETVARHGRVRGRLGEGSEGAEHEGEEQRVDRRDPGRRQQASVGARDAEAVS